MLEDAYQETHGGSGVEDQFIADELPKYSEDEDDEDTHCFDAELLESEEYFPYPNKTVSIFRWTERELRNFVRSCSSMSWIIYPAANSQETSSL
jgi:hypothetical protein